MNEDKVAHLQLVTTIGEKCRTCYTCVRECPAKAIQILDGQASVDPDALHRLRQLRHRLQPERQAGAERHRGHRRRCSPATRPVAAIVAPSYPAEFTDCDTGAPGRRPARARLRRRCTRSASAPTSWPPPTATCSAQHDEPLHRHHLPGRGQLRAQVPPRPARQPRAHRLAHGGHRPRAARAIRARAQDRVHRPLHRQEGRVAGTRSSRARCDAALTFVELRAMFATRGIRPQGGAPTTTSTRRTAASAPSSPSPAGCCRPPTSTRTCCSGDIVTADGRANLADAIVDFEHGETEARLLDILCCEGCIMGAGFSCEAHCSSAARR